MNHSSAATALLLLTLVIAACGGGGDDSPDALTASAPPGHIDIDPVKTGTVSVDLLPLTWTNTDARPHTVRLQATGSATLSGAATAMSFITYRVGAQPAVAVPLTPPQTAVDVSIPAGEAIGTSLGFKLSEATSVASLTWTEMRLTLQP